MHEHIRHSSKYVLSETIEGDMQCCYITLTHFASTTPDSGVNIFKNKNPKPYDVHIKQYKLHSIVEGMAFIAALD